MSVQKGTVGLIFGIPNTTITATGIGTFQIQGMDYSLEGDEKKLRGTDGVTINRTFFDNMEKWEMDVVISAASTLAASLAGQNILPARGADVTLTSATDTETTGSGTADGTGVYIFEGGKKKYVVDDHMHASFTMSRGEKNLPTVPTT